MVRACLSCASLLAIILGSFAAAAQPLQQSEVVCPRAAFSPVLDGRLEDWPRLPQALISGAESWHPAAAEFAQDGGPEDVSVEVRLAWDNQSLYLALEVRDDSFVQVASAAEIDRGDSLVLSISDTATGAVSQFVVAMLSRRGNIDKRGSLVWRAEPAVSAGDVNTIGRALWARPVEDGGTRTTYELNIPWSELRPIRPIPESHITLVISACDDDGEGLEGCLEGSITALLSPARVVSVGGPPEPAPPPALPPLFSVPEVARFDRSCFVLSDQHVFMFGGQIDYGRLPRETWADRVALLKEAGLNTVGVTVPWSYHQPAAGNADLAALEEFLELCEEAGLWVQLSLGPYSGEDWEAGAVPEWVLSSPASETRRAASEEWLQALLPVVAGHQVTTGGPISSVVARPLPDRAGGADGPALERAFAELGKAKVDVPVLTANAPAARANTRQPLASLLDTLSFYTPPAPAELLSRLEALSSEENGPAAIVRLPGDYASPAAARRSLGRARIALAGGAAAITLSDFAPGLAPSQLRPPGDYTGRGVVSADGGRTAGFGEARLLAGFLRQFGTQVARAVPAAGLLQADDPEVEVSARLGSQEGFIFLWDEETAAPHHVRLTYIEPGTEAVVDIPQAGAIYLPPGGAKILPLDVPLGRGVLRYTTSEILAVHALGERTLVVLYGDPDTPGEIALRWPGPPLVRGEVARESWDPETKTLILDYYHGEEDQYLLVDEVEFAILSRARAALTTEIVGEADAVSLTSGAYVSAAALDAGELKAVLECPSGTVRATAALPRRPSSVTIDGEPVPFTFTPPARKLEFEVTTEPFEHQQRPTSIWDQLGQSIAGGPPRLYAEFDRSYWRPDAHAAGAWDDAGTLTLSGGEPGQVSLTSGGFARLRARFDALQCTRISIAGSTDPALVFLNGEFVRELSGSAERREANVSALLTPGENEITIVLHLLPRANGVAGLRAGPRRWPQVSLVGDGPAVVLQNWELSPGLAGEAAGWHSAGVDLRRWHHLRFGPWRDQGRLPAGAWGVGWYRVSFGLPRPEAWRIPCHLRLTLHGAAQLYLNGVPLAACEGGGEYVLPLPAPPLNQGGDNLLAIAAYGLRPETGLHHLEVAADTDRMTRSRVLEIRF